ncbi:MAG: acetate kinase, partial [Alphaproteobacteria bacterium]
MDIQNAVNILVLNAGSSSQKIALFSVDIQAETMTSSLWEATIEWTGEQGCGEMTIQIPGERQLYHKTVHAGKGRAEAVIDALRALWLGETAVVTGPEQIAAVGHRVVHGGLEFRQTTRITSAVTDAITRLI